MTTTAPQTRTDLPAAGSWTIDGSHSSVEFVVRHLMVSKVRGRFEDFHGEIEVAERPEDSKVDFFDAEQFPTITFRSTGVRPVGKQWAVDGELTVHGESRPVTLDLEYQGSLTDPFGNDKAIFSASTEIDREEWGLTWNQALESGGVLVGKKAKIEIEVQAVKNA